MVEHKVVVKSKCDLSNLQYNTTPWNLGGWSDDDDNWRFKSATDFGGDVMFFLERFV